MINHAMTPGPWTVDQRGHGGRTPFRVYSGGGGLIADANGAMPTTTNYANARAIAAVPALVEALQAMLNRYASHESGRQDPREPAQARAALELAGVTT